MSETMRTFIAPPHSHCANAKPLIPSHQKRGERQAGGWRFITGWLALTCAHPIHPLKAPWQFVATLAAQAGIVHHVCRLEGEMALSTRQDQRLAGGQTGQGYHIILPRCGVLSRNADELVALTLGQAWQLRQREDEQPTGTGGECQYGGLGVFDRQRW